MGSKTFINQSIIDSLKLKFEMHVIDLTANYSNMHLFNFSKCFDLIMFNQNDKTGPGENHRLLQSFSPLKPHSAHISQAIYH